MKTAIKKIKSKQGFSLSELLIALVIVSIMTIALTAGISASLRVYQESVRHAEERTLLSTLSEAIINELRNDAVMVDNSGMIQAITSQNFGNCNEIRLLRENEKKSKKEDGKVFVVTKTGDSIKSTPLIGSGAYSNHVLKVQNIEINYNEKQKSYDVVIELEPYNGASESREFSVKPKSESYVTVIQTE